MRPDSGTSNLDRLFGRVNGTDKSEERGMKNKFRQLYRLLLPFYITESPLKRNALIFDYDYILDRPLLLKSNLLHMLSPLHPRNLSVLLSVFS